METTNELEEAMDRMLEAELETARRKALEASGIGKISYKDGRVVFTPIRHEDFYKQQPQQEEDGE